MRGRLRTHCRHSEKNPFLGERWLVFHSDDEVLLNNPEPIVAPGAVPAASTSAVPQAPENIHASIQKGPQKEVMGELVSLFPGEESPKAFDRLKEQYQIVDGGMHYLDKINHYLQTTTENINVGALPWSTSLAKLEDSVNKLEEQIKNLNLNVDSSTFTSIRNQEEQAQRQQMIQMLTGMYERLQEKKAELAQELHEDYIDQYVAEYDELAKSWDKMPAVYKDYASYKKAQYKEIKENLKKQTQIPIPEGDEEKLIALLQSYKKILDQERAELQTALGQVENRVDVSQVQKNFQALQARKQSDFHSRHGAYKAKATAIVGELNRILGDVEKSDMSDTEKVGRQKKIKELTENFEKNISQSDEFAATDFSDPSPFMVKNENGEDVPSTIEGADGSEIVMPKGLKDRIELLNSGKLKPDATNALATTIRDEIKNIHTAIDGFVRDADANFDRTLSIYQQEDIDGPIGVPTFGKDYEVVWMSPMDVWTFLENASESFKRSFNRVRTRKVGKVGAVLTRPLENLNFGPFRHFSVIPGDLDKKQTQAENEAVDFYQNDYKSSDDVTVINILHNARNQDQMKACIQLLCDRGRMNWFDPRFLRVLNTMQSTVYINPDETAMYHANEPEFYRSVSRALETVYGDSDFFRNMHAQNASSYTNGKKKFETELVNMSRSRGGLQKVAVEMLKQHYKAGPNSTVNPQKFEFAVELGVKEGAILPSELGLYFLIQAANSGLLPFERLTQLYANTASAIPYLEIFNESIFNYHTLAQWASIDPIPETFDQLANYQVPHKFMRWFHTYVMHNPRIRNRSARVIGQAQSMDPDLVALFIPYASEQSVTNMLQIRDDASQVSEWVLNNASQYQLFALHHQLSHMDEMDNEKDGKMDAVQSTTELENIVAGFIKWDAIMDRRMYLQRRYTRWTDILKKQKPRSGDNVNGFYWSGKEDQYKTTYGYAVRTRELITQLDPEIFKVIFRPGQPTAQEVAQVVQRAQSVYGYNFDGNPPTTADALYENIAGLIGVIVTKQKAEGGTLTQLIKNIKKENEAFYEKAHNEKARTNGDPQWGGPITFYPNPDNKDSEQVETPNSANNTWFYSDEPKESGTGFAQAA